MISRRQFLQGAAAVGPMIISARALGQGNAPGANETVNVGLIGLGGRCKEIANSCFPVSGMRIVAVCDCFKPRVDAWMKAKPEDQNWNSYLDFREMIEKENLDGVMVETTTHARAWIACHAMAMGMDAYIEKPMCLTIEEGRHMVNVARKYGRVTQVGTQQRSMPLNNWASDLVKNGALGKVHTVLAPDFFGPARWTGAPEEPLPEGANDGFWETWTNQAEMRPYHHDLHYGWANWWDYDGGGRSFGVTGWGTHSYDQVQRGLGTDETGPVSLVLEEPVREKSTGVYPEREIAESETGAVYYNMAKGAVGPRGTVRMTYANGAQLVCTLDADWGPGLGAIFCGEKGKIEINRDKISADPPELVQGDGRPDPLSVLETTPHIENWVQCIKTRDRCNADIEYGQRSSTICYLVNVARDVGKVGITLKWDPDTERFTNCDEANANGMIARPRRKGWELPA